MTYAEPRLRTEREVECDRCGGSGVEDDEECPCCYGLGVEHDYSEPTAADLLTDPRVAALVDAMSAWERNRGGAPFALTEALAAFRLAP